MSITASEIVAYAAANMPEDDTSTVGGAIDPKRRVVFTDLAANGNVEVASSGTSDGTKTITVTGRLADGSIGAEGIAVSASANTYTAGALTFERILKVESSADVVGTVTVRRAADDATIGTIPPTERGFRRMFYNSASSPSGAKSVYEKFFLKNTNATLALTSSVVSESADPSANITFALANSLDDTGTATNRLTLPTGVTAFNSTAKNVPNSQNLTAGSAIGVWVLQALTTGQAGYKGTWTAGVTGNSV